MHLGLGGAADHSDGMYSTYVHSDGGPAPTLTRSQIRVLAQCLDDGSIAPLQALPLVLPHVGALWGQAVARATPAPEDRKGPHSPPLSLGSSRLMPKSLLMRFPWGRTSRPWTRSPPLGLRARACAAPAPSLACMPPRALPCKRPSSGMPLSHQRFRFTLMGARLTHTVPSAWWPLSRPPPVLSSSLALGALSLRPPSQPHHLQAVQQCCGGRGPHVGLALGHPVSLSLSNYRLH